MSGTKLAGTISGESLQALHGEAFLRAVQFFGQSACIVTQIQSPVSDESDTRPLGSTAGPSRAELVPNFVADYCAYIQHTEPVADGAMCPWCKTRATLGVALI